MQKVVKFPKCMIDCNPRVDTLLLSRYDFYVSSRKQKIKLKSQINTQVTQYCFLISVVTHNIVVKQILNI